MSSVYEVVCVVICVWGMGELGKESFCIIAFTRQHPSATGFSRPGLRLRDAPENGGSRGGTFPTRITEPTWWQVLASSSLTVCLRVFPSSLVTQGPFLSLIRAAMSVPLKILPTTPYVPRSLLGQRGASGEAPIRATATALTLGPKYGTRHTSLPDPKSRFQKRCKIWGKRGTRQTRTADNGQRRKRVYIIPYSDSSQ